MKLSEGYDGEVGFCYTMDLDSYAYGELILLLCLFNGTETEEFQPNPGIRPGDPISPYLLLIAAEGLSCLLKS